MCGAVRISAAGEPLHVTYCHCVDCRRASGAPTMVFVGFDVERVHVSGEPEAYRSSPGIVRSFCGGCGASLFYEDEERLPREVHIAIGLFDEPGRFAPEEHSWASQKPYWLRLHDDLPRHAKDPPWQGG